MTTPRDCLVSVVVPLYNESLGLQKFHEALVSVLQLATKGSYEIIYCDDGSKDLSAEIVRGFCRHNSKAKLIKLSRNFGKEYALTAGITEAKGQAIIMLDGDGQHPIRLIPDFIDAWQQGAQVVVGVRSANNNEGWFKRRGSKLFYRLFNRFTGEQLLPGSTDYRLIDRQVQRAFLELKETDRITRGLIDWLGFERKLIHFRAEAREKGNPGYDRRKLIELAINSFVSLSVTPLYWFGYLGIVITTAALVLGTSVFIEQIILNDPWHWRFTGTAMLSILLLFLVGLLLTAQGILSLYVSHIHSQTKQRPLYVIDYKNSVGIERQTHA